MKVFKSAGKQRWKFSSRCLRVKQYPTSSKCRITKDQKLRRATESLNRVLEYIRQPKKEEKNPGECGGRVCSVPRGLSAKPGSVLRVYAQTNSTTRLME